MEQTEEDTINRAFSERGNIIHKRGPGYYLPVGLIGSKINGTIWKPKMESGKTGIYECISYKTYSDPWDMIKESSWRFIAYENTKPIIECNFEEFKQHYSTLFL